MSNNCPHCKEIKTVPSWKFCDRDECKLERIRIKYLKKKKK